MIPCQCKNPRADNMLQDLTPQRHFSHSPVIYEFMKWFLSHITGLCTWTKQRVNLQQTEADSGAVLGPESTVRDRILIVRVTTLEDRTHGTIHSVHGLLSGKYNLLLSVHVGSFLKQYCFSVKLFYFIIKSFGHQCKILIFTFRSLVVRYRLITLVSKLNS